MAEPVGRSGIGRVAPWLIACLAPGVGYAVGAASATGPAPAAPVTLDESRRVVAGDPTETPTAATDRAPGDRVTPPPSRGEAPNRSPVAAAPPVTGEGPARGGSPQPPDIALFLTAEQHAAEGDPVAAIDAFVRGVGLRAELDRDLDLEFTLSFRKQSRLEFVRDLLDGLRVAGIARSAELERATERAVAVALRLADDPDDLCRLLERLRLAHHPLAEEQLLQRLPRLGWWHARRLLDRLQVTDPARHDRLLAAWIEHNPAHAERAERYRASRDPDALLAKDLAAARSGDLRMARATVQRLVDDGRGDEAGSLLEELATQLPTEDVIHAMQDLPRDAQEGLRPDLLDPDSLSAWLGKNVDQGSLPEELAPVWQQRFAAQRWADWAQQPAADLDYHHIAYMAAWQAERLPPSPLTRSLLERSSLFRAGASDDDMVSPDAEGHIVLAFRLGHPDLAIGWMQRRLDLLRARGDADAIAEAERRLTRMRGGVDPIFD